MCLLLAAGPAMRAQTCSVPGFSQPAVYPIGTSDIRGLANADFDGDGTPDLAAIDMGSDSVTVLTRLGAGAGPAINSFSAGHSPVKLAAGDFNGDSKPDLVVANSDGLLMLLNDGPGSFHAAGSVSPPQTPRSLVAGDFNGDGKLDVAAAIGNLVIVQLGNGAGGFSGTKTTSSTASQLAVADFNGDGKMDLAGSGNPVQILFGNGDGTFTKQPNSCGAISSLDGIAAGDLNGDGKPDLVNVDIGSAKIQVVINNGSGCFTAGVSFDVLNLGRPQYIALADLNNDGKRDIVAGTTVLLGDGTGGFGAPFFYGSSSGGATPGSNTVIADFDADGKMDLGTAGTSRVGILFGDGQGGFRFAVGPAGGGAFGLARGDFNSDGKPDLATGGVFGVALMLSDGAGGFSPARFAVPNSFIQSLVARDFDGDGKLDVVALDISGRINTMLGNVAGQLGTPIVNTATGSDKFAIAAGDFNRDGKLDVVTANRLNGSVTIALGDGTGHFSSGTAFPVNVASNPKQIGVADFNGDGKLDLAVPSGFGFSIMLGDGTGGFSSPNRSTTANASSIVTNDFNGDGKIDLAMIGENETKASILLGDGAGSFASPVLVTVPASLQDLTAADFNGDGKLDLAVASQQGPLPSSSVSILIGDGAGNFSLTGTLPVVSNPGWIITGDFNSDGRNDVVTANSNADNLSLLLNTCGGPVNSTPTIQFGSSLFSATEGAGSITITVTRTGSTSGESSVDYATSDGSASSRSDYTPAFGTLRFANGEAVKSFTVLITDDTTPELSNESLNITLRGVSGAVLGQPFQAIAVIKENDISFVNTNPIDSANFFVRQHYYDFLNRLPDQSGLDFWTNQITSCGSDTACTEVRRINVSGAFFLSIEFQQTGYLVERIYKTAYGDVMSTSNLGGAPHQIPVPVVRFDEFLKDSQRIGQNVVVNQPGWETVLENNKQAYAAEFVQTSRFVTAFPATMTPAQFVDKLNQNAGNVLSDAERTTAINLFGNAADTANANARAQAVRRVAEDADLFNAEANRAFVLTQYIGYLRRNPNDAPDSDYTGYDFWLGKLIQFNGNYVAAEMVKAFIASPEYRQRFGP